MIRPVRMNSAGIVVRDIERSLAWYKAKFGFEQLYEVPNGIVIGVGGVELWMAQADDPDGARQVDTTRDICVRLIGFEVSEKDLGQVRDLFPEDDDIIEVDHPRYRSYIIEDPDGHSIELFVDRNIPN